MVKKEVRTKILNMEQHWLMIFKNIPKYNKTLNKEQYKKIKDEEYNTFNKFNFMSKLVRAIDETTLL